MFNSKSKSTSGETTAGSTSIIGAGTVITGSIHSNGDIRIDGTVKGNLSAKAKVLIGADGVIEGDIEGNQADILGKVTGKIRVTDLLYLHGQANVDGDIYAAKLQVEPTASYNGKCHMGANVVELLPERASVVNE
ncbi:MAG: polymer-forming cytoskeletal protein [Bacteroidetes bacterium]|nr:polymer-forming cytoskeletal protein [Bacteroidota bacterium]